MAIRQALFARPRGGIPRLKPGFIPILSYGFRPFFLGAAVWACAAMVLWIALLTGWVSFANSYGAIEWHAHEFLFGYLTAVLTGFLLTAIPNWTGRMPLQGSPLLGLVLLWAAGRIAMLMVDRIGVMAASVVDSAFLLVLVGVILREIVTGRNWRNLPVVILISVLAAANLLFHGEVMYSGAPEYGPRAAVAVIIMLITLIGGRVTPSFTRNWLARQAVGRMPAPLGRYDMATLALTGLALALWIVAPEWEPAGVVLIAAALFQAVRLARWAGERTWREPLVLILHLGYLFVPLGAFAVGVSVLWPEQLSSGTALHAWTTGAVGVMTLAVMTRATLGHTGRNLAATRGTAVIYAAIIVAALARVLAPAWPSAYLDVLTVAGCAWIVAFGMFVAVYGPMLVRARKAG